MHKATQMEEVVKKPKLRLARENGGITNRLAVVIYEDRVRRGSENPGLLRAKIAKDASYFGIDPSRPLDLLDNLY